MENEEIPVPVSLSQRLRHLLTMLCLALETLLLPPPIISSMDGGVSLLLPSNASGLPLSGRGITGSGSTSSYAVGS